MPRSHDVTAVVFHALGDLAERLTGRGRGHHDKDRLAVDHRAQIVRKDKLAVDVGIGFDQKQVSSGIHTRERLAGQLLRQICANVFGTLQTQNGVHRHTSHACGKTARHRHRQTLFML